MENCISAQLSFFDNNKDDLLKKFLGMIIVISPELRVKAFKSLEKGFSYGVKKFGYGNFLLKDCTQESLDSVHSVSPIISVEQ